MARQKNQLVTAKVDAGFALRDHLDSIQKLAVKVDVTNGEYLHYKVVAQGGNSEFVFGAGDRVCKRSDVLHPQGTVEWDWLRAPGDSKSADEVFGLIFQFIGVTEYHFSVDRRNAGGEVIEMLQDVVLQPDASSGVAYISLEVFKS